MRLVFCETTNDKPIWPNIGYDFESRRAEIIRLLNDGCPGVTFMPAKLMDTPEEAAKLVAQDQDVDAYMVCLQGLGWRNDLAELCSTGKPTLVVDNLFGGSGKFLTALPGVLATDLPVDWVSSSDDADIVASAKHFAMLREGHDPHAVAAAFRATRRERTPDVSEDECRSDDIGEVDFDEALRRLAATKILVVGGGWGGDAFRKAAHDVCRVEFVPIGFEELSAAYDQADRALAADFADRWTNQAKEVVEPNHAELVKSGRMYTAMKSLLDRHGASGISINCLGGFYGGHMEAYPCLGFSQLNNDGLVGGCEADQMSALTMATLGALTGRPGFISDPVMDTSKNEIIYAHCVAMTKPFGPDGPSHPFRIRNHSEDRKGAALQSLLPSGYMTTTLELNPVSREMLLHQARSSGNYMSDMACRTKLRAEVRGDIEKLTEEWRMGWHRVTFYGDLKDQVFELSDRLGLKVIEEA